MNILKKLIKLNEKEGLIEKNDSILIGMSGGPDSIFLYELLKMLKKEYNLTLAFAHINHGLRENGNIDEEFVKDLAKRENIEYYVKRVDLNSISKEKKLSIEEAGRDVRYEFFKEVKKELKANKVATAHNLDDNIETFMFNLIRGASLRGLQGIPTKREFYIRPISDYYKKEILSFLVKNNIEYRVDESNLSNDYTRNHIRNELIPFIENNYNPLFKGKICQLINDIKNVNNIVGPKLKNYHKSDILNIDNLLELDDYSKGEVLTRFLQKFKVEISRKKLKKIIELLESGGSKDISLGYNFILKKEYKKLYVSKNKEKKKNEGRFLGIPDEIEYNNYKISTSDEKEGKRGYLFYLPMESKELLVRSRKAGDKLYIPKLNGHKKLKEFFINEKIPKEKRDEIPIIEFEGEVLLVGNKRAFSKYLKKREDSKIIRIEVIEEDE